ncbi:MauE/DoxX family redox-associated membrane protein [Spirillospora sp. NPDC050679]
MNAYLPPVAQALLACVFGYSCFVKLRGPANFARFQITVGKLTGLTGTPLKAAVLALGLSEGATAVLLAVPSTARAGFAASIGLLVLFCAAVVRAVRRGVFAECGCFGARESVLSYPILLRNGLLLAVSAAGLSTAPAPVPLPQALLAAAAGLAAGALFLRYCDTVSVAVLMKLFPPVETPERRS